MIAASQLGGMFAAHAIWCVSDGETLIPIFAYTDDQGERKMERLVTGELSEGVNLGKERLESGYADFCDAALLYDSIITIKADRMDAIIVEMRAAFSPQSEVTLAIPYTPKDQGGFLVHRPKLMQWDGCDDYDMNAVFENFFVGVSDHEKGSAIWNACLDESR